MSIFITAEIGINHNGSLDICKKLIDVAKNSGCDAVKFQKRTVEKVYSKILLDSHRTSPWGNTQRDQKNGLELGKKDYDQINAYCKEKKIEWYCSTWDTDSQKFIRNYNLNYNKIASPMIIHKDLLKMIADEKKYTFISTGMSTYEDIDKAVDIFQKYNCPYELMHTVSTYPMKDKDANLKCIPTLREKYNCKVGYSGHEVGLSIPLIAVALGITSLERHITLDRSMYGSDQAASIEPQGLQKLVRDVRAAQSALGDGKKRILEEEKVVANKLRENIR